MLEGQFTAVADATRSNSQRPCAAETMNGYQEDCLALPLKRWPDRSQQTTEGMERDGEDHRHSGRVRRVLQVVFVVMRLAADRQRRAV